MSVLDRSALEASPLADLHAIASELGIDGFRRLRKDALIDAILERQGDGQPTEEPSEPEAVDAAAADEAEAQEKEEADEASPRRRRRGVRRRRGGGDAESSADEGEEEEAEPESEGEAPSEEVEEAEGEQDKVVEGTVEQDTVVEGTVEQDTVVEGTVEQDKVVEGTVELLGGGSGFVRVAPPDPSDDDVYISAAQVRRCELVSGDVIAGPVRPPRRSERYPSLVRVDTINGSPADEVTAGTRYEEMPCAFPAERLALGGEDPTVRAIEWLTPFGKGSRVAVTGPARSGKTEALRRVAAALEAQEGEGDDGVQVSLVLAGVRPEEVADWQDGPAAPAAAAVLGTSPDSQAQAIERVIEQARRVAARGRDAVVLIDGFDGLHPPAARKVLASARNLVDAGSLTIVAVVTEPVGGETTVITLNRNLTATGRFPALDLAASGTIRPELLVGDAGAEAIAKARLEALER
jgi:transcription termination factor Rho